MQQVFNKYLLNEGLQELRMVLISSSYYYHLGLAKHPPGFWSLVVTIFYGSTGLLAVHLGLWVSTHFSSPGHSLCDSETREILEARSQDSLEKSQSGSQPFSRKCPKMPFNG